MNVIAATRSYVDRIVSDSNNPGMKVLLLDDATTKTVSTVYSQTQILERDVFLVERLEQVDSHEAMRHLKAAVFVRPTWGNIELLCKELAAPKFSEYHVFFANVLPNEMLRRLAEADETESVRQVQEFYADYVAVNEDLFTVNQRSSLRLSNDDRGDTVTTRKNEMIERNISAILSALLSLKTQPSSIRYQASSKIARLIATQCSDRMENDGIYQFKNRNTMLLILDRADDPVTPLLSQWTYQAMVHELLGLNNNRVKIPVHADSNKKVEEVVLSCTQDSFFAKHRYSNFGDLGGAVKQLLDEYQAQTHMNERISTIEDMQQFVQRYPAFRSQSLNVSKHVSLVSELGRLVDICDLMEVSQLEQDIACNEDRTTQWRSVLEKLANPQIKAPDKLRIALLYCLRYEDSVNLDRLKAALDDAHLPPEKIILIDAILKYAGKRARGPGLFGAHKSVLAKMTHSLKTSLEGVENVYAQHVPLLSDLIDLITKQKLKDNLFPAVSCVSAAKPAQLIVFMVGGTTYEEATKIAEINSSPTAGIKILLGGTYIHNSTSFLDDLHDAFGLA